MTSDLLRVALEQHTHAELLALERRVLTLLQFRLTSADPAFFLNYFLHLTCNSHDQLVVECCWLLLETGLVETSLLHTRPSLMAAAALYGSLRVMHGTLAASVLPAVIPNYFRLEERTVLATTTTLLEALSAVARRTPHSPTEGDGSPSWGSALSQHPRLAPDNLLLLVQQLRTRLAHLSRAT
ncbi:uncharacterized protein [Panulirus ornatus]|uniref:uncharacterized protein n=1 Tax=Panulirus ornatus TaxID=150431 RepID=UPI003A89C02B